MRLNISIWLLLVTFLLFNMNCGSAYFVSKYKIKPEYPFNRNFEISKLVVDSLHIKYKHPIKYVKEAIFICSLDFIIDSSQAFFNKHYQSVEDYWIDYDRLDSLHQFFLSKRGVKEVLFFEKQNHISWIQFPFFKNELSPILPTKFEKNRWYKISHLYPNYEELNHAIFFIINDKGKIHKFQVIED